MTSDRHAKFMALLLGTASACAVLSSPAVAAEARQRFDIRSQDAAAALNEYARQAGVQIVFPYDRVRGKTAPDVQGDLTRHEALALLTDGMGLRVTSDTAGMVTLRDATDPQSGSAAGGGAEVEALIVTAQKREEDIQDVPIAISAFSQEDLTRSQVAGGPDLMTQVPNMTFTKTNFSSYSIQIRGIGTQAISATTDAAVAVAFNNTPFIRNRFFEQEFYDLQRVEVLRGPQGTLYGRNATAGVVNIISAKPVFGYEAKLSADVANYNSTRLEGMINVPLAEDVAALRIAGAWTKREGFVTNEITGEQIDGRDLWSTRVSLRVRPTESIEANLIWEHFEEDDDRLRSGKQVCNRDFVTEVGGIAIPYGGDGIDESNSQANFSQGCRAASMYAPESFQAPNGYSIPYYHALGGLSFLEVDGFDPYLSVTQSSDLRVIESTLQPRYQAESDVVELQLNVDLTDNLTVTSETGYSSDTLFSFQDYNRFNTREGAWRTDRMPGQYNYRENLFLPDGSFCDPQLGCASRLVAGDVSTAKSRQFSQEFRIGSNFDGPLNFSLGANFLRYDTEDKYYVFINSLTLYAATRGYDNGPMPFPWVVGVSDNSDCLRPDGMQTADPDGQLAVFGCIYIDPNPIDSLNDEGHNYFLSRNPYKLISYAAFGELYYNLAENLKVTAGLRWTVDKKEAPRIPSWVLGAERVGYPVAEVIEQEWREPTGRLTVDWKPDLAFTDDSLLYASYAHGYKAGGANPPAAGTVYYGTGGIADDIAADSATNPRTFEPEFIDAFEVGSKNTFMDGRVTLNASAFYYDYGGYQISYITDRSAVNLNFDSKVWGVEIEADWRPLENLRLGFKGGHQGSEVAEGERAIDVMDRTGGLEAWTVMRPHPTQSSNCIVPTAVVTAGGIVNAHNNVNGGGATICERAWLQNENFAGWNPDDDRVIANNGAGIYQDLSGNELPNAPHYTATITADYTIPLPNDWAATLHTDLYYQSEAWTRIFNTEGYDKLKAYTNVNFAAIFTNEDAGWKVMAYIKNVMDRDSITGAFLNSDDTGLTTNVFLTEPRLYGLRVTKEWSGGPWWTGANLDHKGPYPLTVEISGQVQSQDAPYETVAPSFAPAFFDEINTLEASQHGDLDWGDGRSLRLTYRPSSGPWTMSAGVRYGRTNGTMSPVRAEQETDTSCAFGGSGGPALCEMYADLDIAYVSQTNWSRSLSSTREYHNLADFAVGRDFGLGATESILSLGMRYANFESDTAMQTSGTPDWHIPAGWFMKYEATRSLYTGKLKAVRQFEGVGPTATWDGSQVLFEGIGPGRVSVDWLVAGGVLFGKQKTSLTGTERVQLYEHIGFEVVDGRAHYVGGPEGVTTTVQMERSNSTTVPLLDLSLGLSYEVGRLKLGAGYRWERYFDVLDVGNTTASDADRTIDGPYVKIAVGFGG